MAANGRRQNQSPLRRVRVGNADQQSARKLADSQTLAAPIYGGQRSSPEPEHLPANTSRQRRPTIRKESCGFADLGRFNIWRPTVVARPGGSKWQSALPTRRQQVGAGSACRQQVGAGSACPATVSFIIAHAARFGHPLRKKLAGNVESVGKDGRRLALRRGGVI